MTYLERQGVGMAVMGERELALGMAEYALRSLGLSEDKARLVVQDLRASGEAANRKKQSRDGWKILREPDPAAGTAGTRHRGGDPRWASGSGTNAM